MIWKLEIGIGEGIFSCLGTLLTWIRCLCLVWIDEGYAHLSNLRQMERRCVTRRRSSRRSKFKGSDALRRQTGTGTGTGTRTGRKGSLLNRKLPNSDQLILSLLDRLKSEHELSCIKFISNR